VGFLEELLVGYVPFEMVNSLGKGIKGSVDVQITYNMLNMGGEAQ
jgi:hypothetical protein